MADTSTPAAPSTPTPPVAGLLAEFDTPEALKAAAERVREEGYRNWDAYSPFPVHGLERAMGIRPTILPLLVFGGGVAGGLFGLLLQIYTNSYDYPYLVSGKPYLSLPAFIPITFETIVLFAAITTFLSALLLSKLPQWWHPVFSSKRFARVTDDGFFLALEACDPRFDEANSRALLESLAPVGVEAIYDPADSARMPKAIYWAIALLLIAALLPLLFMAKARVTRSPRTRLNLISDMDFQASYRSQEASVLFADRRAARPQVVGTIARGDLRIDDHFFRGRVGEEWVAEFPRQVEITAATMRRGQERFGIYCAACHGLDGEGAGIVSIRAAERKESTWVPPLSLHAEAVREQRVGQVFNTITNGVRNMPPYGSLIPVHDRWAIVLYVQALQRSQSASVDELPADLRDKLPQ